MKPNLLAKLQAALEHHHAGRPDEAERLYRAVLRADARNADALNLLGVLEYERGRNLEALDWLSKAIQMSSKVASFHNNLGLVLVALGRHGEAALRFEQAGQLDARLPDAFYNLGVARQSLDQTDEAVAAYLKALALAEEPGTLNNLGAAYLKSGRREEAIRCYERALQLQPDHADALFNLAVALLESGHPEAASAHLLHRSRLPEPPLTLAAQLGLALELSDHATDAETWYRQALLSQPTAQVYVNLAHLLEQRLEFTEAEHLLRQALKLQPDDSKAFNDLGIVLLATGRAEEAVLAYDQAIQIGGDDPLVYYNRGHARLVLGDFAGGWDDYEYRWQWKGFPHQRPPFVQPAWTGDDLQGRTLLVYNEQGWGDTIQFARYLCLLADQGARVLFAGPAELKSLLGDLAGACQIPDANQPLPPFDVHAALMSLPRLCGTRLENIPASVPYLPLPPVERFPLPPTTPGRLRVGLVWAGRLLNPKQRLRSIPLQDFLPLLQTADCDFFSLQVGPSAADLVALPAGIPVTDIGSRVRDFADTAAVMGQLDLIISVDTATLHLAGALARPVWGLLPYVPDWRWLLQREDSPWYPTMRLFRQPTPGDWKSVVAELAKALQHGSFRPTPLSSPPSAKGTGSGTAALTCLSPMKPNLLARLQAALEQHHAGRLDEAEQLYRAVLRADAQNADALHLLGVLEYQRGRTLEAITWLSKAIQVSPQTASFHNNLGVAQQSLGQVDEAIAAFLQALSLTEELDTLNNLGAAYLKRGRREEAIRCYERAFQLQPDHADALFNLAVALLESGHSEAASVHLLHRSRLPEPPLTLAAHLGRALQLSGHATDAETWYRKALLRQPTAQVCINLAHILGQRLEFTEAEQLLRQALKLQPDNSAAFNNLGTVLQATGRAQEAVLAYDQAIQISGDDPHAYYNRGHARLLLGDFAGGWDDYEYRWLWKDFTQWLRKEFTHHRPPFVQPAWTGDDLKGRTLLVYNEQGRGDIIQFVRYLRLLSDRGARVLFSEPAELKSLLGNLDGACQVVEANQPLPQFDVHAALMSLPRLFGTRLESIPASVPYLPLPPVERFPLPPATPGRLRVGLVWEGGTRSPKEKLRSIPLKEFVPLLQTANCDFFSLQVGPRAADLAALPAGIPVTDIGSHVRDFADTAAVMGQLDLIISVDTATLHLAGALARPAWALLPYVPDWRWLLQREDSPWYPTLRLFRQGTLGDWAGVLNQVQEELRRVARLHRESGGPPPLQWFQPSPTLPVSPAVGVPPDHKAGELNQLFMSGQTSGGFGWAVVNRGLFEALSKIAKTTLITPADREFLSPRLPGYLLTTLGGHEFVPECPARARVNFGNEVFEQELTGRSVENAKRFDVVFVASTWCVERMREKGIPNGALLLQGIDTRIFRPAESKRQDQRFVLFSGGKFEFRKGQDLVLRAFRVLARKFPDMVLVTSWHNLWPYSLQTMAASSHIRFELKGVAWADQLAHLCAINDIDPQRVVALPPGNPEQMAATYRLADLGLFPNRCEGATNLVLMEFLACGRPAIVSFNSGHCDVVSDQTALLLKNQCDLEIKDAGKHITARWKEVSVDDLIAAVEYAYHHRAEMQLLGARAAEKLARWDWARAAQEVLATMKRFAV